MDKVKRPLPFNLVVFSPPGGGKSTQSKKLKDYYHFHYVMTGNLVRKLGKNNFKVHTRILEGKPEPNSVIIRALRQGLKEKPPYLIDTLLSLKQIKALEAILKEKVYLLSINVQINELKKRLHFRAKMENRVDDTPFVIEKRIQEYQKLLLPLKAYFKREKRLIEINGNASPTEVNKRILNKLSRYDL